MRTRLLFVLALLAGCSDSKATQCDKYASMEVKCNGGEGVRDVARSFCESSAKEKDTDVMAAMISLEAACAQKETDCDAYAACIEKAKKDTTPPGM